MHLIDSRFARAIAYEIGCLTVWPDGKAIVVAIRIERRAKRYRIRPMVLDELCPINIFSARFIRGQVGQGLFEVERHPIGSYERVGLSPTSVDVVAKGIERPPVALLVDLCDRDPRHPYRLNHTYQPHRNSRR